MWQIKKPWPWPPAIGSSLSSIYLTLTERTHPWRGPSGGGACTIRHQPPQCPAPSTSPSSISGPWAASVSRALTFAQRFSDAVEGLGFNHAALKDLFNSALDEPLNWWRMRGLDHLTFVGFIDFLARQVNPPSEEAAVPPVVAEYTAAFPEVARRAAAPPVVADDAAAPQKASEEAAAPPEAADDAAAAPPVEVNPPAAFDEAAAPPVAADEAAASHSRRWRRRRKKVSSTLQSLEAVPEPSAGQEAIPEPPKLLALPAPPPSASPCRRHPSASPSRRLPSASPCRRLPSTSPCWRHPGFLSCRAHPGSLPSCWLPPGLLTG